MDNKFFIYCFLFLIAISFTIGFLVIRSSDKVQDYVIEQDIKATISFMQENHIQIWGMNGCSWCQKQLAEFGEHQDEIRRLGLYKNCEAIDNLETCQNLFAKSIGTPFFTMNGEYLTSGYRTLKEVREVYKYQK